MENGPTIEKSFEETLFNILGEHVNMTKQSAAIQDNPLFIRYGSIVQRCFAPDVELGTPIAIFPPVIKGIKDGEHEAMDLDDYIEDSDLESAQKTVDKLRASLLAEAEKQADSNNKVDGPVGRVSQQLREFQNAVRNGNEAMMDENAFYELTGLFYRLNLKAMKNSFINSQKKAVDNPPRSIQVSRSYSHIWGRGGSLISFRQKITETLGKVASIGKVGFGLLLFCGSSLTTAKGVIDLVQLPGFVSWFGDGFVWADHETIRNIFALFIGVVLSSVILDFKSRLFQGTAEVGRVFKGYWYAFKRYPRWVFIACFLTMASIWTNYDGIVLLMSKTQDLSVQWEKIQIQVGDALGDPKQVDPDNPDSLLDLDASLTKKAKEAIKKFKQVPEDEISGLASSGVATKGPRYWAKYYIINGGYQPGRKDVGSTYKKTAFVRQVDLMLRRSGLDLSVSLEEKINRILKKYADNLNKTRTAVEEGMGGLGDQMTFKEYSLDELFGMFKLESYHINKEVQKVVGFLGENKNAFAEAALELNNLAQDYIVLLSSVDKLGVASNTEYVINVKMDIPEVEAIDRLRQGEIPMAERRTLAELKDLLLERYGIAVGGFILSFILFISVFMDMSDPILYSAMTARWGRRDRHFLDENTQRFEQWENLYIQDLKTFFVQPSIMPVLPKLRCPDTLILHDVFNQFLEEMNPAVMDASQRGWWDNFRFWFMGLFVDSRISHVDGYNARQTAILRYAREGKTYAPRLLNHILPGVMDPVTFGIDHFDTLFAKISKGLKHQEKTFNKTLESIKPETEEIISDQDKLLAALPLGKGDEEDSSSKKSLPIVSILMLVLGTFKMWFSTLFFKSIIEAEKAFPLTRSVWLREVVVSNIRSRVHINALSAFTPGLVKILLEKIPVVQKDVLVPLNNLQVRIPNWDVLEKALDIKVLKGEFVRIESGLTVLFGLSQFQGFQVQEKVVNTIIDECGVDEISAVYLTHRSEQKVIEDRIDRLADRLSWAYRLVNSLVEGQSRLIFTLTKIRRDHLSPIDTALSKLQRREVIETALGIDKIREEMTVIERFLLELWDASRAESLDQDVDIASDETDHQELDLHLILSMISSGGKNKEFGLIEHVDQLQVRASTAHKGLNSAIFQLTFIDKIMSKVHASLGQSMLIVEEIFGLDARSQDIQLFEENIDQNRIIFLTDNRLFFRTIPLQVASLQARIDNLIDGKTLPEKYHVTMARTLDQQAVRMQGFLKNALDYIEGKRDGVGLSAAMTEWQQNVGSTNWSPEQPLLETEESIQTEKPEPKLISMDETSLKLVKEIQNNHLRAKQILLDVSLREWDLMKMPLPPQELLKSIRTEQSSVEKACQEVEKVQTSVTQIVNGFEEADSGKLTLLRDQTDAILNRLDNILNLASVPATIDRRASLASESTPLGEENRKSEKESQFQGKSRRVVERTVIKSQVEVTTESGQQFSGITQDISVKGLCLEATTSPQGIKLGTGCTFSLASDAQKNSFPAKIVRIAGPMVILTLVFGHEAKFVHLIREEVMRDRGGEEGSGVLDMSPPKVP